MASRDAKAPGASESPSKDGTLDEKADVKIDVGADTIPDLDLKPVSFTSLFRFSTRLEIFLDIIGIFCAVVSGAAQVRLTLHPSIHHHSYISESLSSLLLNAKTRI